MLAALYERLGTPAFSLAIQIVEDTGAAEEVVASVFSILRGDPVLATDEPETLSTYVLSLVRRHAIERRHSDRVRQGLEPRRNLSPTEIPGFAVAGNQPPVTPHQQTQIRLAMAKLSIPTREAIELVFFEGLTTRLVAERAGVPHETAQERLREAMLVLRDALVSP